MTDKELIAETLNGELESYSELVRRYERNVRACLAVRLSNTYESEDLAQEAFIIAYRKLAEFDQTMAFGPWVRSIAFNLLRNYQRKHKPVMVGDLAELNALLEMQRAENKESEEELLEKLKLCLEKLKSPMRELISLRYMEEYSIKELTEQYVVSHSTLTMRLHRIREQLSQCVKSSK